MNSIMSYWPIYFDTKDYPGKYVLRRHTTDENYQLHADAECVVADTLEAVRVWLPLGVINIGRYAQDDPLIVEVWI